MALEYEILDNGWTVRIHTPINDIDENDQAQVLKLLVQNTCVFWRGQDLTPQQELDFCYRFGNIDFVDGKDYDERSEEGKSLFIRDFPGILRVTAKPGETGLPGQFAHKEELQWHCNQPNNPNRKPFVWLYSVEGSKNSVTHWSNSILAYNDMSGDLKEYYDTLSVGHFNSRFRTDLNREGYETYRAYDEYYKSLNFRNKLVLTNSYGQKGIHLSPLQVGEIAQHRDNTITVMEYSEMIEFADNLLEYLTQPKYVYSHHWQDGDVIIGEQFFGVHKRDAFEDMHKRYLHRIAFNSNKIYPDLAYEGYNGNL